MMPFSERLRLRSRVWWKKPGKWRTVDSYRNLFHRLRENYSLLDKDDPDSRWHCCDLWQRLLSNKWNAREFAQRNGVRVPALYWYGRRLSLLPIDALPDNFVIRPIWGAARRGIYVFAEGKNLLDGRSFTKATLKEELVRTAGRVVRFPTMIEEVVKTESGQYELPIEYKCHMFGSTVGAIDVVERSATERTRDRSYRADWVPFEERVNTSNLLAEPRDPPRCFGDIVACARRLGAAYGTYVRADLYASDTGCIFGEFSSTPMEGQNFTPFADRYFGELWERTFPDRT